jgi:hypothetical protein
MAEPFEEATVHLMNQKVHFTGVSKSNPNRPIAFDYKPPIGDGEGDNKILNKRLIYLTSIDQS